MWLDLLWLNVTGKSLEAVAVSEFEAQDESIWSGVYGYGVRLGGTEGGEGGREGRRKEERGGREREGGREGKGW